MQLQIQFDGTEMKHPISRAPVCSRRKRSSIVRPIEGSTAIFIPLYVAEPLSGLWVDAEVCSGINSNLCTNNKL